MDIFCSRFVPLAGGVIVGGPALTQVVDELRSQVGLPKIGDERDRQLMVTARAGLETWVAKKFKEDLRLKSKILGAEATLKERIDCLREACPELSRVVSMAHFLRMIGNNSAHTGAGNFRLASPLMSQLFWNVFSPGFKSSLV